MNPASGTKRTLKREEAERARLEREAPPRYNENGDRIELVGRPQTRGQLIEYALHTLKVSQETREVLSDPRAIPPELLPDGIRAEVCRWSWATATLIIADAYEDVRINDVEVMEKFQSAVARDQLIARKRAAWEWFFEPWEGLQPRVPLELVCQTLHLRVAGVRYFIRYEAPDEHGHKVGVRPPVFPMPPGVRYELFHTRDPEDDAEEESYWGRSVTEPIRQALADVRERAKQMVSETLAQQAQLELPSGLDVLTLIAGAAPSF